MILIELKNKKKLHFQIKTINVLIILGYSIHENDDKC